METAAILAIVLFGSLFAYLAAVVFIVVRMEMKAAFQAKVDRVVARFRAGVVL
jgi:hypothetical protein